MKKLWWVVLAVVAVKAAGLVPFESNDVASLVPVEALVVSKDGGLVVLNGGECKGYGANWAEALVDLHEGAEGTVFLSTAEQVIISDHALDLLPDVVRCEELRPAAVICVAPGKPPEPKEAAAYLSVHDAGVTIQKVQAAMLAERGLALPMLVKTEGGLRLYGSSNR